MRMGLFRLRMGNRWRKEGRKLLYEYGIAGGAKGVRGSQLSQREWDN